ncbi:phosphopantetheine-binding protein (plasmid) [Streptomyces sp. QTS137]
MTADAAADNKPVGEPERTMMIADSVRAIWCRELKVDDIVADDDFFTLGGQSVIMFRIQDAFMEELGVEVPMDQMFLNPTVASISAYIESLDPVAP